MFNRSAFEDWMFRWMVIAVLVVLLNHVAVAENMSPSSIASMQFVVAMLLAWANVAFCRANAATSSARRFWAWAGVVVTIVTLASFCLSTPVDAGTWLAVTLVLSVYSLLEGYRPEFEDFLQDTLVPWIRRVNGSESTSGGL